MLKPEELGGNVGDWVSEMNYSVIFIRELVHDVVRENIITYTWLSVGVKVDLAQEA